MKYSIEKERYSIIREESYKKECYQFAFDFKNELVVNDQTVYILKGIEKLCISKPMKKNSFWFETWTELKKYYNI